MPKMVSVYSAATEMQAEFLAQVLGSHGIEAQTAGGSLTQLAGYLPATYARTRVLVDEEDVERARGIVEDFEQSRKNPRPAAAVSESWVCANCGELIEPQFTDCWNCQTPSSRDVPGDADDAKAPATSQRLPPDPHIGADLACVRCAYNLRNLPVDRVCPECAHPALASLLQAMHSQPEWSLDNEQALQPCLDYVEQECGFPIEAIAYVLQQWPRAVERASAVIGLPDVTPHDDDVAVALRDLAIDFFGDPLTAARAMQRWRLGTGTDLRRLRARLEQFGLTEG
jgi:hypothetical protein